MLKECSNIQSELALICIEDLVPACHLLRKIDRTIDFLFIYRKVESLCCTHGRPPVDPVMLFKMLLIG